MHTPSSCFEWTEEALSVQRKALYLPPLHQAARELILLLGRSGGLDLGICFSFGDFQK